MWHILLMWLVYGRALDSRTLFVAEKGNVFKSNCQKKFSNKLNQISRALNLTSLKLMLSEKLFKLKSRLAQLHGAIRQFLNTGHEVTHLLLQQHMDRVETAVPFPAWNKSVACVIN